MVEFDRIKITHTYPKRNEDFIKKVKVTFKLYNIREDGELLYWGSDQSISRLIERRISKKSYSSGRKFMIRKYFQESTEEPILLVKVSEKSKKRRGAV